MGVDVLSVRASTYASVFTFFSVIFTVIAFSTPYWLAHDGRSVRRNFQNLGLWEACFDRFRDPDYQYDREFRGCKWLFDEDYSFLLKMLEPSKLSGREGAPRVQGRGARGAGGGGGEGNRYSG